MNLSQASQILDRIFAINHLSVSEETGLLDYHGPYRFTIDLDSPFQKAGELIPRFGSIHHDLKINTLFSLNNFPKKVSGNITINHVGHPSITEPAIRKICDVSGDIFLQEYI